MHHLAVKTFQQKYIYESICSFLGTFILDLFLPSIWDIDFTAGLSPPYPEWDPEVAPADFPEQCCLCLRLSDCDCE